MEETSVFDEMVQCMGRAKDIMIGTARDNQQNPNIQNIVRQGIDHLDAAYLFASSMVSALIATEQAVEKKAMEVIRGDETAEA